MIRIETRIHLTDLCLPGDEVRPSEGWYDEFMMAPGPWAQVAQMIQFQNLFGLYDNWLTGGDLVRCCQSLTQTRILGLVWKIVLLSSWEVGVQHKKSLNFDPKQNLQKLHCKSGPSASDNLNISWYHVEFAIVLTMMSNFDVKIHYYCCENLLLLLQDTCHQG